MAVIGAKKWLPKFRLPQPPPKSKNGDLLLLSSSSENDEDSAQGEIFVPDPDEVLSRESSAWEGSKSSDSEEESLSSTLQRTNIINEHINDLSLSEGDSSASFHDDSSYESSVGDDLMSDLYDDSDDDEVENDGDPDSEDDDELTCTEEE